LCSGDGFASLRSARQPLTHVVSPWLWKVARKRAVGAGDGFAFGLWPRRAEAWSDGRRDGAFGQRLLRTLLFSKVRIAAWEVGMGTDDADEVDFCGFFNKTPSFSVKIRGDLSHQRHRWRIETPVTHKITPNWR